MRKDFSLEEKKSLSNEFKELEQKNFAAEYMFKNLPGGYHRCANEEGYPFLYVSERFLSILGWTEEELRTKFDNKFMNLVHPDDRRLTPEYVSKIVNKSLERPYQDEIYRLLGKDGYHWISDTTVEITVDGKTFLHGFITDITRFIQDREKREAEQRQKEQEYQRQLKKAAQEARRANEAKTIFLRRLSHDIRTPINGIIGLIEMADRYRGNKEKLIECKQRVLNNIDYLLAIVNNVLDIGKVESGEVLLDEQPFDLIELLDKQLHLVEMQAWENGININGGGKLRSIKHRHLIGSPVYLSRIMVNLGNNAVKYTHVGGSISLAAEEIYSDEKKAVIRFTCEDTGVGMSEEFQKRLFVPYAQEGRETSTTYTGSGLGLSIVKAIVEQMQGSITFESREGVGTKFIVTLPFAIDHNIEKLRSCEEEQIDIDVQGKRALLVEDNKLNIEIAQLLLGDEGLLIDTAHNGKEAVELFNCSEPYTYDMIFMDIMMPVMDGLEATRQIRKLDRPDAKSVPILAMTANAFRDDMQKSREAGMNVHLTKPLDRKMIKAAIRQVLEHKNS